MAFSGVELLEVGAVGDVALVMWSDIGLVAHIGFVQAWNGGGSLAHSIAIMDTSTGDSLLYAGPTTVRMRTSETYAGGWWDPADGRWYYYAAVYTGNNFVSTIYWLAPNGDSGVAAGSAGNFIWRNLAADSDWIYCLNYNSAQPAKSYNRSTSTWVTHSADTPTSVVTFGGDWWCTAGGNLYSLDPSNDTRTLVTALGATPGHQVTIDGDWIWWWTSTAGIPIVGWNRTTGAVKHVVSTPPTGFPSVWIYQRPAILDGVAYMIASDRTKMVAVHLATGRWLLDDLVTSRGGRSGTAAGNNKIWIPSTVTPP